MKLKHLESALSSIQREFPSPKVDLEQYPTSAHLAAWVGLTCLQNDDIGPQRSCMDLGCGTGMLALSCALLDTDLVVAVDCDEEALMVAKQNYTALLLEGGDDEESITSHVEFVLAKLRAPPKNSTDHQHKPSKAKGGRGRGQRGKGRGGRHGQNGTSQNQQYQHAAPILANPLIATTEDHYEDGLPFPSKCVDTVITNPPFGTKHNAGMDLQFLRTAIRLARRAVYSFHKTSTRPFLIKTCQSWGLQVQVVAAMKFDIPQVFEFHKRKSVDVEVDLIRVGLVPPQGDDGAEEPKNNDNNDPLEGVGSSGEDEEDS
jgi:rRNA N6-adenosine-methyltransferase METTL5